MNKRKCKHPDNCAAFSYDPNDICVACSSIDQENVKIAATAATAADILADMQETYKIRSKAYGANFVKPRNVIRALFPHGVPSEVVDKTQWHIFEMVIIKLTRFADSGLEHVDSVHDSAVYCAIIEEILGNQEKYK